MTPAAADSPERIAALKRYDILDTPREAEFDQITRLAAQICDVPVAIINFVDRDRQWFKSEVGLNLQQTSLDPSFSASAILQPGFVVVSDPTLDSRFAGNPLVLGPPQFRFYASAVIESSDGFALGALCILDYKAHGLLIEQQQALQTLAHCVSTLLELRRTSKLLNAAKQATVSATSENNQFLITLCHELRASLAPVLMSASLLLLDKSLSQTQRAQVENIRRQVELETRLINDLLELLQITYGELELSHELLDIHDLIERAEQAVRSDGTSIPIEKVFRASSTAVLGDAGRLEQTFRNLLSKALRSTSVSGYLAIITNNPGPDLIRIRIVDMGSGMEPEAMPALFAQSEVASPDPTSHSSEYGLTLSVANAILGLHKGSIKASSSGKSKFAMFTVELPTLPTAIIPKLSQTEIIVPSVEGLRILLVERDENTAQTLAKLLRRAGHDVETADSVSKAKILFGQREFDLLISDLGLPDGNGFDLMRQLKAERSIDGIALTDNGAQNNEDLAAAGFGEHLAKPVDWSKLEAAVRQTARRLQPI